jgi:hypothetical protein
MKGWLVDLVLACALVVQWAVTGQSVEAANRRTRDALHIRDTLKARHAEREVEAEAQADSLRAIVARAKSSTRVILRHDTALVPLTEYVYIRDTLIPKCEACAARVDSLVAQNRVERLASDRYISALQQDNKNLLKQRQRAKLTSRVGFFIGYGTQRRQDGLLFSGPILGFGVRILP